jgi:RND family efflux transporter MFP subunit
LLGGKILKPNFIGVILIAAFFLCFIANGVISQETEQPTETVQPTSVHVETPRRVTIVSEKIYNGFLQPRAEVKVFANIPGKIVSLNVEAGQKVAKGDMLAQISAREASIAAIKTEVTLSVAKSQLTTTEANAQTRVETQLVTAKEAVAEAEAKHEETKSLAELRIRNQLLQAESALKVAESNFERAKVSSEQGLERAKTEFTKTTADYERDKELHEQELISDSAYESSETRYKLGKSRYEEAVASANQFKDGTAQLAVEKAKAELAVAQKIVESKGWEREIAAAEAKVTQTKANLVTAQKLVDAKAWEREIAIAKSAVSEAEEQLKLAREQVNQAAIISPIDGVIAQRHQELGDYAKTAASSGQPIYTVVALDVLKAVWTVPVSDINRIKNGNMVLISTASGIQNIIGTIDFISPTVKQGENTVVVHATLHNLAGMNVENGSPAPIDNGALKPGTSITISIKTGERQKVLMLPRRAVLQIQNGTGNIFSVEAGVARLKQVNVGGVYGSEIEINSRLAQATQVIVDNQHLLKDGISVSVVRD